MPLTDSISTTLGGTSRWTILALLLLVANAVLMAVLGTSFPDQLRVVVVLAGMTATGLVVMDAVCGPTAVDTVTRGVLGFLVGFGVFLFLNLGLFHLQSVVVVRWANWLVFAGAGAWLARSSRRRSGEGGQVPSVFAGWELCLLLSLAVGLAVATTYSFAWGHHGDARVHLGILVDEVAAGWLPGPVLSHRGLQVFLLGVTYLFGGFDPALLMATYRVFGFVFLGGMLYLVSYLARVFFALGGRWVALVMIAVCAYGAVNYPLFTTQKSSYMGLFNFNGYQHNITMLFSTVLGAGGLVCYLLATLREARTFALGMGLVAASFFIKPSFFSVLAPMVMIMALGDRQRFRQDRIVGYLVLWGVVAFWKLYPAIFGIPTVPMDPGLEPFRALFTARRFPPGITGNAWLHATAILGFSLALPLALAAYSARWMAGHGWPETRARLGLLAPFVIMFLLGAAAKILLYENNARLGHGNFGWAFQSAYLVMVPMLVKAVSEVRNSWYRALVFVLLGLHLWGGILRFLRLLEGRG